ncbi:hypothetical protein Tco_0952148 [Tanacetum coccineum]|uniref:Uncharacterized protein n=1 Tax=Tanacetum coccineum TaxID=301880 RepID=A0ABQ5DWU1_9ASTR
MVRDDTNVDVCGVVSVGSVPCSKHVNNSESAVKRQAPEDRVEAIRPQKSGSRQNDGHRSQRDLVITGSHIIRLHSSLCRTLNRVRDEGTRDEEEERRSVSKTPGQERASKELEDGLHLQQSTPKPKAPTERD